MENVDEGMIYNDIETPELSADANKISDEDINGSSIFDDGDCGEPMSKQRVVLDFTPVDDLDNDDVQKKCCAFWDFVNSHPELDDLMVNPKADTYNGSMKTNEMSSLPKPTSSISVDLKDDTALSVLEFVEEKVRTNIKEKGHKKYKTPKEDTSPQTSVAARNMCHMFEEWDLEHPKSMSPPGPVPQPGFKDAI